MGNFLPTNRDEIYYHNVPKQFIWSQTVPLDSNGRLVLMLNCGIRCWENQLQKYSFFRTLIPQVLISSKKKSQCIQETSRSMVSKESCGAGITSDHWAMAQNHHVVLIRTHGTAEVVPNVKRSNQRWWKKHLQSDNQIIKIGDPKFMQKCWKHGEMGTGTHIFKDPIFSPTVFFRLDPVLNMPFHKVGKNHTLFASSIRSQQALQISSASSECHFTFQQHEHIQPCEIGGWKQPLWGKKKVTCAKRPKNRWTQEMIGKSSLEEKLLPRKLTCSLKINGWKMYVLLKIVPF